MLSRFVISPFKRIQRGMFKTVTDCHYWNAKCIDSKQNNASWMGKLENTKLSLAAISIPGTHDTMTSKTSNPWARCQSLSLRKQLDLGIRYLDIRCRLNKKMSICHGPVSLSCDLRDCIEKMTQFLDTQKSECLIVRVKNESVFPGFDVDSYRQSFGESFKTVLKNFDEKLFWLGNTIPTIHEAKGKIVVIRDFTLKSEDKTQLGIPYSNLAVEDNYKQWTYLKRYKRTEANLEKAVEVEKVCKDGSPKLFLTHSSAVIKYACPPSFSAKEINLMLYNYIKYKKGRFGIIAMDYPGPCLIRNIINKNLQNEK